jgi:hypothetical protein
MPSFPQTQQFFQMQTGAKSPNKDKSLSYKKKMYFLVQEK